MKKALIILLVSATGLLSGCQQKESDFTYQLGTVSAFSELVNAGVKQLALSPVFSSAEMDEFLPLAKAEAEEYNVEVYRENDLIVTDLFPADVAKGKEVLLLFQGLTKDAYLRLKADKEAYESDGDYTAEERHDIARYNILVSKTEGTG